MKNDRRNSDPEAEVRDIRRRINELRATLHSDSLRSRTIRKDDQVEEQTQRHKPKPKDNPAADEFKRKLLKLKKQKEDKEWKS